jgi:hypothetical protein
MTEQTSAALTRAPVKAGGWALPASAPPADKEKPRQRADAGGAQYHRACNRGEEPPRGINAADAERFR